MDFTSPRPSSGRVLARAEGEGKVGDEPVRGRRQSDGGEAAGQVWFVDRDGGVPGGNGIGVQPGQGQLVRGGEQHDRVGRAAPAVDQVRK
jgi:hypothetical protein